MLTPSDIQHLTPYLHLPVVMEGISTSLEGMLGIRLVQAEQQQEQQQLQETDSKNSSQQQEQQQPSQRYLIYEVYDCGSQEGSCSGSSQAGGHGEHMESPGCAADADPARPGALGVIYIDLQHPGGTTQLLTPGPGCPLLGGDGLKGKAGLLSRGHGFNGRAALKEQPAPASAKAITEPGKAAETTALAGFEACSVSSVGLGPPAVVLGLQSRGCLSDQHLSLGLWELCHELGHALHMILSASSSSFHHHQAPWLPVEVLELPSTLMEGLVMRPGTLRVMCRHRDSGEQLSMEMAEKLAKYMKAAWYNPVVYHHMVSRWG